MVDIYRATADTTVSMLPHLDEVVDTRWISFANLAAVIAPMSSSYSLWLRI
jgi:isopentenyldiphosphate isomerase